METNSGACAETDGWTQTEGQTGSDLRVDVLHAADDELELPLVKVLEPFEWDHLHRVRDRLIIR